MMARIWLRKDEQKLQLDGNRIEFEASYLLLRNAANNRRS